MAHKRVGASKTGATSVFQARVHISSPKHSTEKWDRASTCPLSLPGQLVYLEFKACCPPLFQCLQLCSLQVGQWVIIHEGLDFGPGVVLCELFSDSLDQGKQFKLEGTVVVGILFRGP